MSDARERLSDAVETTRTEAVCIERYGRPAAVLVSPERYGELMGALEDAEDVGAFDEAMAEVGPTLLRMSSRRISAGRDRRPHQLHHHRWRQPYRDHDREGSSRPAISWSSGRDERRPEGVHRTVVDVPSIER